MKLWSEKILFYYFIIDFTHQKIMLCNAINK